MKRVLLILALAALAALPAAAQEEGWKQLFNGKDLTGWKHVGPGKMYVEDGLIKTEGGMGLLYWTGGKSATASSGWSTGCATRMTTPASLSAFPSSRAKSGCP